MMWRPFMRRSREVNWNAQTSRRDDGWFESQGCHTDGEKQWIWVVFWMKSRGFLKDGERKQ